MRGIIKFLLVPIVALSGYKCDSHEADIVDAIPADINTEPAVLLDKDRAGIEPIKYDGAQLWRISFANQHHKNAVAELQKEYQAAMWNLQMANESSPYVDMFVKRSVVSDARSFLKKSDVPYEIVISDVQEVIDSQNPPFDDSELWQNRNGHPMTWDAYHRLANIYTYMDYLTRTYPSLCSQKEIGKSHEGRSLKVLKISDGKTTNKAVWVDAGIHAREWISPAVATYIIDNFVENWSSQSASIKNIDWYFLPVMNPDGYEHTHTSDRLWRKNRKKNSVCSGVDLNRNYGYRWGGQGASRQPCAETYAGAGPFSEPETKAVENFLKTSAADFKASLSFHSYGQYILYPWGYDRKVPPDYMDLERVGKEGAAAIRAVSGLEYSVGPAASMLYPAAGGSDDWAKGTMKFKYSYTVEMRDTGRHGFLLPASEIRAAGNEMIAFMSVIANAVGRA